MLTSIVPITCPLLQDVVSIQATRGIQDTRPMELGLFHTARSNSGKRTYIKPAVSSQINGGKLYTYIHASVKVYFKSS